MALSRFNATIQFPDKSNYLKLKALSIIMDETIGATLVRLIDAEADKQGLKVGVWDNPTPVDTPG